MSRNAGKMCICWSLTLRGTSFCLFGLKNDFQQIIFAIVFNFMSRHFVKMAHLLLNITPSLFLLLSCVRPLGSNCFGQPVWVRSLAPASPRSSVQTGPLSSPTLLVSTPPSASTESPRSCRSTYYTA